MKTNRTTKDIIQAAKEAGCEPVHQSGSHQKWECPDTQKFTLVKNGKRKKEQDTGAAKEAWKVIDSQPGRP